MNPSAAYLLAQGILTLGWWLVLLLAPASRELFTPEQYPDGVLTSFWLADLVCVAAGSLLAGWQSWHGDSRSAAASWFVSGALTYAALYCLVVTWRTGEAVLATVLMIPAAVLTLSIAARVRTR